MKLTCPSCGALHSAEAWVNDAQARQCLLLVAELPADVGRRALPYLALFRNPGSGRALTWGKALRLLGELRTLVSEHYIQWDRSPARPNNAAAWAEAMEQMVQRPPRRLPLTSHGYLRKIAYDLADEKDRAAEVKRNRAERAGTARPRRPVGVPTPPSLKEMQEIRKRKKHECGRVEKS